MSTAHRPLVSVVVRSMDRPQLADALASLARQTCRSLEILVVDATGGRHRPLPSVALHDGHTLRLVTTAHPLPRPHAANAGIDAARGEFLSFLDDDDTCEPEHLQTLLDAAAAWPDRLVVYGRTRMLTADGRVERMFGGPFNRALLHCGPLFFWQAALIRTRVRDLGCRVEESLEICEDRDFLAQVACHSDFAFVPVATFNYRGDLGTSGTGRGANRDDGRRLQFDALLRARWKGAATYHVERVTRTCRRAVQAYLRGDRDGARTGFLRALADYPGDPNALHGLARLQLEDGALSDAHASIRCAIDVDGGTPEQHLVLARVLERLGDHPAAVQALAVAARDPLLAHEVAALRPRLRLPNPEPSFAVAPSRVAPCTCGSGRRHKDCCGQLRPAVKPVIAAASDIVTAALREATRGEALGAARLLAGVPLDGLGDAATSSAAAAVHAQLADYARAVALQRHAVALTDAEEPRRLLAAYCERLYAPVGNASAYRTARTLLASSAAQRPAVSGPPRIHLVTSLASLGGTETRALALRDLLAPHADVTLWTVVPPHPSHVRSAPVRTIDAAAMDVPDGGTLVLVGTFFDIGDWLHGATFERVVVCYNVELPVELVQRLTQIREPMPAVPIDLTFPTQRFRARCALPGRVEMSPVHVRRFAPALRDGAERAGLVIGRHSRDDVVKHHPNDPSLYRRLVARGHRLRILGGAPLADRFGGDRVRASIELLPAGTEPTAAFLASLDCFLYRKSPTWYEVGGTVILEAMAMALPVVVFDEGIGGADWIVHGETGYLVQSEDEALAVVAMLASDPARRARIGAAARRHAIDLVERDRDATLSFYLGARSTVEGRHHRRAEPSHEALEHPPPSSRGTGSDSRDPHLHP